MTDSSRFWTPERDTTLREIYPTASWEAMQEVLGVSRASLQNRAFRLGLTRKHMNQVERVCARCGKTFRCAKSRLKYGPAKFCSDTCRYTEFSENGMPNRQERAVKECNFCGKEFKCFQKDAARRRFCSQNCMIQWRDSDARAHLRKTVAKIPCTCQWCGQKFERYPSELAEGRGIYCSKNCVGAATAAAMGTACESQLERNFAQSLRESGLVFETQFKFRHFLLDIAFPEERLAVEVDGDYWHNLPNIVQKDKRKDAALREEGWKVVHIWEKEINSDLARAKQRVFDAL